MCIQYLIFFSFFEKKKKGEEEKQSPNFIVFYINENGRRLDVCPLPPWYIVQYSYQNLLDIHNTQLQNCAKFPPGRRKTQIIHSKNPPNYRIEKEPLKPATVMRKIHQRLSMLLRKISYLNIGPWNTLDSIRAAQSFFSSDFYSINFLKVGNGVFIVYSLKAF